MARILVLPDDQPDYPLLDERHIGAVHLESEPAAIQLLERLEWAIREANEPRPALRRPRRGLPMRA